MRAQSLSTWARYINISYDTLCYELIFTHTVQTQEDLLLVLITDLLLSELTELAFIESISLTEPDLLMRQRPFHIRIHYFHKSTLNPFK